MAVPSRSRWLDPDHLLAFAGLAIVVAEFYLGSVTVVHGLVLALGTLLLYVGSWRLLAGLIRNRRNWALRGELNRFVSLVREIYDHRYRGDSAALHQTRAELHASLDRIIRAAATYQEVGSDRDARERADPTVAPERGTDPNATTVLGRGPSGDRTPTPRPHQEPA